MLLDGFAHELNGTDAERQSWLSHAMSIAFKRPHSSSRADDWDLPPWRRTSSHSAQALTEVHTPTVSRDLKEN